MDSIQRVESFRDAVWISVHLAIDDLSEESWLVKGLELVLFVEVLMSVNGSSQVWSVVILT